MADPYQVLRLDPGSGDDVIRRRYLEMVRRHPPDRDPKRFAEIRSAYEKLRDPTTRLQSKLFELDTADSLDAILEDVHKRLRSVRIPTETLLSLAEPR